MNTIQYRNYNSTYSIIILMVTVFVLLLSYTNIGVYFDQIALAKDSTNTTSAAAGKDAGQNAESLVRSIMDPSSLMSSVINETRGNSNQMSHGPVKNSTTNENGDTSKTITRTQVLTKTGNTSTTSTQPSSAQTSSI